MTTPRRGLTRRGLLVGAAATGIGVLAADPALGQARTDDEILASSIGLEQLAAFVYEQMAEHGGLAAGATVARAFARQEREHAAALTQVLSGRGGSAPAAPRRVEDVTGLDRALAGGARAGTAFAVQIEQATVTAYYAAVRTIEDPGLLRTTTSIMALEAQHLVVLRGSLGYDPTPDAFVTGRRR